MDPPIKMFALHQGVAGATPVQENEVKSNLREKLKKWFILSPQNCPFWLEVRKILPQEILDFQNFHDNLPSGQFAKLRVLIG